MSHSYNKIWIHAVFSTKDRQPLITAPLEEKIYGSLKVELTELGCHTRIINGMPEHVHLLFLQNPVKSISEILKQIKGSTSHWINEQNLIAGKFAWQTGYGAFSVSESQVQKVHNYITNQKQHHQKKTFQQEYDEFILAHGLLIERNG